MEQEIFDLLAKELKTYRPQQIKRVLELLLGGNTVPFIARYRKEVTGNLDEVQIREIEERYHYLENLEKRKEEILRLIEEQDKLTPELAAAIKKPAKCNNWKTCIVRINKSGGPKQRLPKNEAWHLWQAGCCPCLNKET